MKNLAYSAVCPARRASAARHAARGWFARLLWRAFPGPSERAVAMDAAAVLGVSPRTVTYWLRGETEPGVSHVAAVLVLAGLGAVLEDRADG